MLKHISWKQPQLRSSGPRNGFNGSHYTQVTWSRTTSSRGYIHVDLCHLFHFLRILSFRVQWMKARFFGTSRCPISPVAREESAITKMGEEKGVESWNSMLRIVTIVRRWKDDRDGISFASPSSAKVSSIFVQRSGTLFAKSPRNVLLSSCQFEMWHHSYFDLLRRSFGDESVKIVSSGTRG